MFKGRPSLGYTYAGYGVQTLGSVIAALGGCFPGSDSRVGVFIIASVEAAAAAMVKLELYSKGLDGQLKSTSDQWENPEQFENDDIKLTLGDVVCGRV